jgi:hypothetical protein
LIEVLGPAATETEKLELRQKELALAAKNAGSSSETLTRAQNALNQEFRVNALRETVSTLGQAASRAQEYDLKVGELGQKLRRARFRKRRLTGRSLIFGKRNRSRRCARRSARSAALRPSRKNTRSSSPS